MRPPEAIKICNIKLSGSRKICCPWELNHSRCVGQAMEMDQNNQVLKLFEFEMFLGSLILKMAIRQLICGYSEAMQEKSCKEELL